MKYLSGYTLITLVLLITFLSCSRRQHEEEELAEEISYETETAVESMREISEVRKIFYDIYSPVEAGNLFEQIGAVYDPSLLNPPENVSNYNTTSKIALNLGVYGADLSFCRLFGQAQESINYLSAIYRLSGDLGISGELIEQADEIINQALVSHPDTIFNIAASIYMNAEKQLKESNRESATVLILTGGWIEALYIATSFYDPLEAENELITQLAGQKYSLQRLISLMNNFRNNPVVLEYIYKLEPLAEEFNEIEIYFNEGDVEIDTMSRTITASEPEFRFSHDNLEKIADLAESIRNDIIK